MIYIEKVSKRAKRKHTYEMNPSAARLFLYSLSPRETNTNDYFLAGADKLYDFNELIAFFNPKFFETITKDMFTVYKINGTLSKEKRMRGNGAKLSTIENFKTKIRKKLSHSAVLMIYQNKVFKIQIDSPISNILLICDYKLTILRAYAITSEGNKKIDIKKNDGVVRVVNGILRKQRYYYKRKVEEDAREKSREKTDDSLSEIWD